MVCASTSLEFCSLLFLYTCCCLFKKKKHFTRDNKKHIYFDLRNDRLLFVECVAYSGEFSKKKKWST